MINLYLRLFVSLAYLIYAYTCFLLWIVEKGGHPIIYVPRSRKDLKWLLIIFTDSYAAYGKFRCRWKFRPTGYAKHSWPWVVYAFNSQWPSVTTGHLFLLRVIYRNLWHSMKYSVAERLAVELISVAIGIPALPIVYWPRAIPSIFNIRKFFLIRTET